MRSSCALAQRAALLAAAGVFFVGHAQGQQSSCTFATSPTECGFTEQAKDPPGNRATIVGVGRDGITSVRLHTEPGDHSVADSGDGERNDLLLTAAATGCPAGACEGVEQWWAHSIFFPTDFATPRWHPYVLFDFHGTTPGPIQANFHVNFQRHCPTPDCDDDHGDLVFTGNYGDPQNPTPYSAIIAQGGATQAITNDAWYDFVYHVKWSSGSNGFFDAWVQKPGDSMYRRVLAHQGPTLYSGQGVYLKLANYHLPICDPYPACRGTPPLYVGTQPPSSVYHDRVMLGTLPTSWEFVARGRLEGQFEENEATSYPSPSSWPEVSSPGFSGGKAVRSTAANASVTFTFTGRSVAWMGTKCETCGAASVSVDGGAPAAVPTNDGTTDLQSEAVWSTSFPSAGSHTVVITSTSSAEVFVDGFWVNPL